MADINYSEYTWKDCKFDPNKHPDYPELRTTSLSIFWPTVEKILDCTITINGDYSIKTSSVNGNPYISAITVGDSDLRITCVPNNMSEAEKDNWYLKVQSDGEEIKHQDTDDVLTVTCKSTGPKTITEINLGEKTAHKVYNSYQWVNQATRQQESYWPWGCKLETALNADSVGVRIDNNTEYADLKRYSIPNFYTDDRSISGYGWYRGAKTDELLNNNTGYQSTSHINPFNTNKPERMLFLSNQLRDPGFTIVANNWQWEKVTEPEIEVKVVDNNIYCNNELAYVLQPGDVLVEYTTTSVTATADQANKPIGFYYYDAHLDSGQTSHYSPLSYYSYSYSEDKWISSEYDRSVYNLRFEPIDTRFYVEIGPTAPHIDNVSSSYNVSYRASAPAVTVSVKQSQSVVGDHSELYESILRKQDYVIQASFVTTNQNDSITEPFENLWRCDTGAGLTINMSLTIPQVPYFSFSPFNNINQTINVSQVKASTSTSSAHIFGPNGEVERTFNYKNFHLGPNIQCNNKILKRNFTYDTIAGRGIYQRSVLTWYDVLNVYGPSITTATKTELTDATETFRSYVVWHFQLPPDQITDGTGNGNSTPGPTPH